MDTTVPTTRVSARIAAAASELARLLAQLPEAIADGEEEPERRDEPERIEKIVLAFLDAVDRGDLDTVAELLDPAVTYRSPGRSRIAGRHEGIEAVLGLMQTVPRPGATDLRTERDGLIVDERGAASFHRLSGRLDGREVEYSLVLRLRVDDDLIDEIVEYTDDQYLADELFDTP